MSEGDHAVGPNRVLQSAAPILAAASVVIGVFPETGGHWTILLRPVFASVAIAATGEAVIWLITRRIGFASVGTTLVVLLMTQHPLAAFLIGLIAYRLLSWWWFGRVRGVWASPPPIAQPVAIVACALTLVSILTVVLTGSVSLPDHTSAAAGPPGASRTHLPNIYVLLLDGYPRADSLADVYAYDNSTFLEQQRSYGFDVLP